MREEFTTERSPFSAGVSERSSLVDRTLAGWLAPYFDAGEAVMIDVRRPNIAFGLGLVLGGGASAPPEGFRLADRGNTEWSAHPAGGNARHPVLTTYAPNGRPALLFGAGGSAPNVLNGTFNGALKRAARVNAAGVDINNRSIIKVGTGWTAWGKFALPAPGATVGAITFPTDTYALGGSIMGGGQSAATNPFTIYIRPNDGQIQCWNRNGDALAVASATVNVADGNLHSFIANWNPTTGLGQIRIDGNETVNASRTMTTDVVTGTGYDRLIIGGVENINGGVQLPFGGFLFGAGFVAAPIGENAQFRGALNAAMALE